MTCKRVVDFLDAYLSGELPRVQRWIFDAHIALCRDCRNYIAGYKKAIALSQEAAREGELPPLPAELVEAILRARAAGQEKA